jgi:hypothetical protein
MMDDEPSVMDVLKACREIVAVKDKSVPLAVSGKRASSLLEAHFAAECEQETRTFKHNGHDVTIWPIGCVPLRHDIFVPGE